MYYCSVLIMTSEAIKINLQGNTVELRYIMAMGGKLFTVQFNDRTRFQM